jgi:hypothetical protein
MRRSNRPLGVAARGRDVSVTAEGDGWALTLNASYRRVTNRTMAPPYGSPSAARSFSSAVESVRETCACESPSSAAMSPCVRSR